MEDFGFFDFYNDNSFVEFLNNPGKSESEKINLLNGIDISESNNDTIIAIINFCNELTDESFILNIFEKILENKFNTISANIDIIKQECIIKKVSEYINLNKDKKDIIVKQIFDNSDINSIEDKLAKFNINDKEYIIDMIINTNFLKNNIKKDVFISFINHYNITFEELIEKAYLSNKNFNRIIKFFIEDEIEHDWENILLYACKLNDVEIISLIINKYPALINYKNDNKTLLMYIFENTHKDSDFKGIEQFINKYKDKIDFNAIDNYNKNIFMYVMETQNYNLINFVIENMNNIETSITSEMLKTNKINYDDITIKMLCYLEISQKSIDAKDYKNLKSNLFKKIYSSCEISEEEFEILLNIINNKLQFILSEHNNFVKEEKVMLKTSILLNEGYKNTEYFNEFGKSTIVVEINTKDKDEECIKLIQNAIKQQTENLLNNEIKYIDINCISNDICKIGGHSFFIALDKEEIVVFDSAISCFIKDWSKIVLGATKNTIFEDKKIKILKTSIQADRFSCRNYLLEIKKRFSEALQSQNLTEFFSNEENFDKEYSGRSIENMELDEFKDYFNSTFKDSYELIDMLKCLVGIEQRSIGSLEKDLKCEKEDKDKLRESSKLCNNKVVNGIIDIEKSKSIDMLLSNTTKLITIEKMNDKLKEFKEHNDKLEECCGVLQKLNDKIFYLKLQNLDIFIKTKIEQEKLFVEKMYFSSKEIEERLSKQQVVVS